MGEILVLILILLAAIALVGRQIVRMVQDKGGCHHCPGCPGSKPPAIQGGNRINPTCHMAGEASHTANNVTEDECHG